MEIGLEKSKDARVDVRVRIQSLIGLPKKSNR